MKYLLRENCKPNLLDLMTYSHPSILQSFWETSIFSKPLKTLKPFQKPSEKCFMQSFLQVFVLCYIKILYNDTWNSLRVEIFIYVYKHIYDVDPLIPDGQSLANLPENSSYLTLFWFPFKFLFHFPLLKITNFEGDRWQSNWIVSLTNLLKLPYRPLPFRF